MRTHFLNLIFGRILAARAKHATKFVTGNGSIAILVEELKCEL